MRGWRRGQPAPASNHLATPEQTTPCSEKNLNKRGLDLLVEFYGFIVFPDASKIN
jgi:hypothetical protein